MHYSKIGKVYVGIGMLSCDCVHRVIRIHWQFFDRGINAVVGIKIVNVIK
ncbi:MAG: hypothetical protein K0Q63_1926, partial [Paenibacillus sp.]|nr:hypothetical protein [Paenibacillus sp.]